MLSELGRVPSDPRVGPTATPGPEDCHQTFMCHLLRSRNASAARAGVPSRAAERRPEAERACIGYKMATSYRLGPFLRPFDTSVD